MELPRAPAANMIGQAIVHNCLVAGQALPPEVATRSLCYDWAEFGEKLKPITFLFRSRGEL